MTNEQFTHLNKYYKKISMKKMENVDNFILWNNRTLNI